MVFCRIRTHRDLHFSRLCAVPYQPRGLGAAQNPVHRRFCTNNDLASMLLLEVRDGPEDVS